MTRLIGRVLTLLSIGSMLIDTGLGQNVPTTSSSTSTTMSPTLNASTTSAVGNASTPAAVVGVVSIVMGPANQTVDALSSVLFDLQLSATYTGRVIWRVARSGLTLGVRIIDSTSNAPNAGFPSSNYQLVNQYALNIMAATWRDGGIYTVVLSDADGIYASATLVVIDSIVPSVSPALTPNATTSNTTVTLMCTVVYGGPDTYNSPQEANDRMPQLSMALGSMDLTNTSSRQLVQGQSGMTKSVLTLSAVYTLTPYEVTNAVNLACTVTTANPSFSQTEMLALRATPEVPDDPSKRFIIDPRKDEYDVDDIISCSVKLAYPEATAVWIPVNSPGYQMVDVAGKEQLVVDEDMPPGQHTWACVAIDPMNNTIEQYDFTFNVSGHHSGWWLAAQEAERQKRIGLGVGLGIGLFFLLLIIIVVIYCLVVKKRQEKRRPPTVSKQPPPASASDAPYRPLETNPGAEYTPSQVPPPIYQPKTAAPLTGRGAGSPAPSDQNAVPLLERSGHGDLGGSAHYRPQSPAARSTSTVASSVRPNGGAPDAGSNAGFADLGPLAGPPSANRSMLSHNTSVISSGASSIVDPAMQQSSRPLSNRTYMAGGGPRDSGRDQLIPPSSGHATGV